MLLHRVVRQQPGGRWCRARPQQFGHGIEQLLQGHGLVQHPRDAAGEQGLPPRLIHAGAEDDPGRRRARLRMALGEQGLGRAVGQHQIADDELPIALGQSRSRRGQITHDLQRHRRRRRVRRGQVFERHLDEARDGRVVLDQQHPCGHRGALRRAGRGRRRPPWPAPASAAVPSPGRSCAPGARPPAQRHRARAGPHPVR
mmetsp:Transcript_5566/g.21447  ORF Transcript_5566/g.21447 Transcript_5566/m.21447 type:complete len:200 (+) Transcript_5566:1067-1666(+)